MHLACCCPTESISKYHYLTYIHVPFHLHAGPLYCISLPSRSHLSSIKTLSQTQPRFKICISSASSSCPTLIQVRRISYHPHPCTISLSNRSIDSHFTSIQVVSEFHPGHPDKRLTSIQVVSHLNPGLDIYISPPSRWRLTSIQIPKIASHLHPGSIWNPSRSWYQLHPWSPSPTTTSKNVLSHLHPCTN